MPLVRWPATGVPAMLLDLQDLCGKGRPEVLVLGLVAPASHNMSQRVHASFKLGNPWH